MPFTLIYGSFAVKNAPILVDGTAARFTNGRGDLTLLGQDLNVAGNPSQPSFPVSPGSSAEIFLVQQPETLPGLFIFPDGNCLFGGDQGKHQIGIRLQYLNSDSIAIDELSIKLNSQNGVQQVDLDNQLLEVNLGPAKLTAKTGHLPDAIYKGLFHILRPTKTGWTIAFAVTNSEAGTGVEDRENAVTNTSGEPTNLFAVGDHFVLSLPRRVPIRCTIAGNVLGPIRLEYETSDSVDYNVSNSVLNVEDVPNITDVNIKKTVTRTQFTAPLDQLRIDSDGLIGHFTHPDLWAATPAGGVAPVDRIEDLSRFLYFSPDGSGIDVELGIRPIHGTVEIPAKDEQAVGSPPALSDGGPLLAGYHRLLLDGEVQNLGLFDRSNSPVRLFGKNICTRHNADGTAYTYATLGSTRARIADTLKTYTLAPILLFRFPCLSLGDLSFKIDEMTDINVVTRCANGSINPTADTWMFPIALVCKTPIKSDFSGVLRNSFLTSDDATDPRQESYFPRPAMGNPPASLSFRSTGQFLGTQHPAGSSGPVTTDLMAAFSVQQKTVLLNQPENTGLVLGRRTVLTRPPSFSPSLDTIRALAMSGSVLSPEIYTTVDFTMQFPAVPPAPAVTGELKLTTELIPQFTWYETGVSKGNSDLSRTWSSGTADWHNLLKANYRLSRRSIWPGDEPAQNIVMVLPGGWSASTEAPKATDGPTVIRFDAIRNVQTKPPTLETYLNASNVPCVRISNTLTGVETDDWWRDTLIGSTPTGPFTPNWSGVVMIRPSIAAVPGLPASMANLLELLPFKLAWWDGQGATAVCSYTPTDGNKWGVDENLNAVQVDATHPESSFQMLLGQVNILIRQNQVETVQLAFRWRLPFFDQDPDGNPNPTWVDIKGRLERDPAGNQSLVFEATVPSDGISVGFLGVTNLIVSKIRVVIDLSDSTKAKVSLDGTLNFDASDLIVQWFGPRLKKMSFTGMSFNLDKPFLDWTFPELNIDTSLDLLPQGFKFDLRGFGLGKPTLNSVGGPISQGIRNLIFTGDLHMSIPYLDWIPRPTFSVDLNFQWDPTKPLLQRFSIGFENQSLDGLEVTLFSFIRIKLKKSGWNKDHSRFEAQAAVAWSWSSDQTWNEVDFFFVFGSNKPNPADGTPPDTQKYWVVGLNTLSGMHNNSGLPPTAASKLDLGIMQAQNIWLLAGHRTTTAGLRDAVLSLDFDSAKKALEERGLDQWVYTDQFNWFAGASIEKLSFKGLSDDIIGGANATLILSDDGIFRISFALNAAKLSFATIELGLDASTHTILGRLSLPEIDYGAYKAYAGVIGFVVGEKKLEFSWGYPFGLDWSQAMMLHWDPPPWPIPINTVEGGLYFGITDETGFVLDCRIAVRVGYSDTIGSDGGAFGAFISGSVFVGIVVNTTIAYPIIVEQGILTLDLNASGGLIVFGFRWNILTVWLHADVVGTIAIDTEHNSMSTAFAADFSAGFRVCLTPCTCISSSVSFQYQFGSTATGTKYPADQAILGDESFGIQRLVIAQEISTEDSLEYMLFLGLRKFHSDTLKDT